MTFKETIELYEFRCLFTVRCCILSGAEAALQSDTNELSVMGQTEDDLNMAFLSGIYNKYDEPLLSRRKRDLSWEDVEKFYEDKNNFAMFLVLPIIVIVYGGCAVIYCIARCRRYAKRRKRKHKSKGGLLEDEPLDNATSMGTPQSGLTTITSPSGGITAREGASSTSEVMVSMEADQCGDTPLPWQVPGEKQNGYPAKGAAMSSKRQPLPNNQYVNSAFEDDFNNTGNQSTRPPPYEESMNYNRPTSKPPPYDGNNKARRESVEEIITLDPTPMDNNVNQRKRRRSDGRSTSRQSSQNETKIRPPPDKVDEEREKARALVRGDKPRREIPPRDRQIDRERTPDIISHARTRPLEPRYKPAQEPHDPNAMAKQAAQLLRLDHMGKQGKKQKRLVFVAE